MLDSVCVKKCLLTKPQSIPDLGKAICVEVLHKRTACAVLFAGLSALQRRDYRLKYMSYSTGCTDMR